MWIGMAMWAGGAAWAMDGGEPREEVREVPVYPALSAIQTPTLGTLIQIPGGTFGMGSPISESGRDSDEGAEGPHVVTLSPFWIMEREVTQAIWQAVVQEAASSNSGPTSAFAECGGDCPMDRVSWCDAVWFANELSRQERRTPAYELPAAFGLGLDDEACNGLDDQVVQKLDVNGYRLPTEAEWEYAARGGESFVYAGSNRPGAVAWFGRNSKNDPHHTCRKGRNGYGLCDMTGNILEWVWDFYGVDYAQVPSRPNPTGVTTGSGRVYRGGSWADTPEGLRVANRFWQYPGDVDVSRGFRLVASALTQSPAP